VKLAKGRDNVRRSFGALSALLVVSGVGLAACSNESEQVLDPDPESAAVVAGMGQTFELRPGQTARVGDAGLVVGFRGVTADSRCPIDAICVWAGDAALRIPVSARRAAWTPLDLHTNIEPRSARYGDYTITVVSLLPSPRADQKIPNERYTVTLRVE
jgi:hypothetical protein